MISVFCKDNVDLCLEADWPLVLDRGGIGVSGGRRRSNKGEEGRTEKAEQETMGCPTRYRSYSNQMKMAWYKQI